MAAKKIDLAPEFWALSSAELLAEFHAAKRAGNRERAEAIQAEFKKRDLVKVNESLRSKAL